MLFRVDIRRGYQPILRVLSDDLPVIVVHEHVVMAAQQYPVGNVGVSAVSLPVPDVVGFRPAGRPVAPREHASAIPRSQRDLLVRGE